MPERSRIGWRYILIFLLIILVSFFPSLAHIPSGRFLSLYFIVMRNIALLCCFLLSYRLYKIHRTTEFKTTSLCIFIAFAFWVLSGVSWAVYYLVWGGIPTISLADLFFFFGYIFFFCVFISVAFLYRNFITRGDIAKAMAFWILVLIPAIFFLGNLGISLHESPADILIISLYPILDGIIIFLFFVLLFMYRKTKIEFFLLVLAIGILTSSMGDFFLLSYHAKGIYYLGSFPDNAFLFSLLFIAFGFSIILRVRIVYFTSSPLPERVETSSPKYRLEKSKTYLFEEGEPKESLDAFHDLITHGVSGLTVVRSNPDKMRQMLGLARTPILWLSGLEREDSVSPGDLGKLTFIVSEFVRKTHDSVIYMEGIEYLIIQNDFMSVLKMVNAINDLAVLTGSCFILTINPHAFSDRERAIFERRFEVYEEANR